MSNNFLAVAWKMEKKTGKASKRGSTGENGENGGGNGENGGGGWGVSMLVSLFACCCMSLGPLSCCAGNAVQGFFFSIEMFVASNCRLSLPTNLIPSLGSMGGPSPRFGYATPPPLPTLRAHLVTKDQWLRAIHRVAPKAPENFDPFARDHRECRGYVALPPTRGPP